MLDSVLHRVTTTLEQGLGELAEFPEQDVEKVRTSLVQGLAALLVAVAAGVQLQRDFVHQAIDQHADDARLR